MTKAEKALLQMLNRAEHGKEFGRLDAVERNLRKKGYIMIMDNPGRWPYRLYITTKGEQALVIAAATKGKRKPKKVRVQYKAIAGHVFKV